MLLLHGTPVEVLVKDMGYEHLATTTRYGNTCCASCGNVDTARLVNGTGFYAVAAAQSMWPGVRRLPGWINGIYHRCELWVCKALVGFSVDSRNNLKRETWLLLWINLFVYKLTRPQGPCVHWCRCLV